MTDKERSKLLEGNENKEYIHNANRCIRFSQHLQIIQKLHSPHCNTKVTFLEHTSPPLPKKNNFIKVKVNVDLYSASS